MAISKHSIGAKAAKGALGAFLAVSVMPTAAHATGYLQIPSLPGETESKKDSGEAHLDYLTITLTNAKPKAGEDHSAGDEHEITYDVSAGALKSKQKMPRMTGIAWGAMVARPADTAHGSRLAPRPTDDSGHGSRVALRPTDDSGHGSRLANRPTDDSGHGSRLTGIRQHTPVMTASAGWRGCKVGARYDHILVGDGKGKEFRLSDVTVARCDREYVSFTYQKIG